MYEKPPKSTSDCKDIRQDTRQRYKERKGGKLNGIFEEYKGGLDIDNITTSEQGRG